MGSAQHRSPMFEFASDVVDADAAADPIFATMAGVGGFDHLLTDFSPAKRDADIDRLRVQLATLAQMTVLDDVDRVAALVLEDRLRARLLLIESGEWERTFSVIASPVADIRQVFELMSVDTPKQHDVLAQRLARVRRSLASWRETLEELAHTRTLPSRRHLVGVADQAQLYGEGAFVDFVGRIAPDADDASALVTHALDAQLAFIELAAWIRDALVPAADERDACGRERYALWARYHTGAELDLEELYAWGAEDLGRISARMWEIARVVVPGATRLTQAAEYFEHDPSRQIHGTEELLTRLRGFTERAVEALEGTYFDIDPRVRFCDARLAPEGSAAAPYYIGPSEDLSRPGTTWFPTLGATTFSWWQHASTWYHEGVPGHHLQNAISLLAAERQSRFQRLDAWYSAYGEGWALYAERLMDELGFFADPGEELGFLAGQALRAARVVVDIGLHLGLRAPVGLGELGALGDCSGRTWDPEMAVALLETYALEHHDFAVSEVDRYLGLPGQAISYKVGERAWLRARERANERLGAAFSLKAFHAFALNLGPMGLDDFESELEAWSGE
ncbi:MAG TPA: DUF885 domain-containing protein [Acidimicrobiales bacterium]|nr:DUF885 domain-containing protein [Acidimicrobiales bacterium]